VIGIAFAGYMFSRWAKQKRLPISVDEAYTLPVYAAVGACSRREDWLSIFARRRKHSPLIFLDVAAVAGPLGIALGRIANFINGELWGRANSVPWAVIFSGSSGCKWNRGYAPSQPTVPRRDGGLTCLWDLTMGLSSPTASRPNNCGAVYGLRTSSLC
jgi:hypothetical protein